MGPLLRYPERLRPGPTTVSNTCSIRPTGFGLGASAQHGSGEYDESEARRFGFGWQGRYTLPFAVGLPILCGFALSQRPRRFLTRRRVAIVVGAAFGVTFVVAQFGAFAQNLRRYTVGHTGTLLIWRDPAWSPPVSPLLLLIAYGVLLVALAVWVWAGAGVGPSDTPADTDHDTRVAAPPSDQVPGLEYTRSG